MKVQFYETRGERFLTFVSEKKEEKMQLELIEKLNSGTNNLTICFFSKKENGKEVEWRIERREYA